MFMLMKAQRLKWSNCEVSIQHEIRSQGHRIAMLLQQDNVWKLIDMIINVLFMYYVHLDTFKVSTLMSIFLSIRTLELSQEMEHWVQCMCCRLNGWRVEEGIGESGGHVG